MYNLTCEHNVPHTPGICAECEKMLNEIQIDFIIALDLIKKGVKVARLTWKNSYIVAHQGRIYIHFNGGSEHADEGFYWKATDEDLLATDWVLMGDKDYL